MSRSASEVEITSLTSSADEEEHADGGFDSSLTSKVNPAVVVIHSDRPPASAAVQLDSRLLYYGIEVDEGEFNSTPADGGFDSSLTSKVNPAVDVIDSDRPPASAAVQLDSGLITLAAVSTTLPAVDVIDSDRPLASAAVQLDSRVFTLAAVSTPPDGFKYNLVEGRRKRRTKKLKVMSTSRLHVSREDYNKLIDKHRARVSKYGTAELVYCGAITHLDCLDVVTKGRFWSDILVERLCNHVARSSDRVGHFHVGSPTGMAQCIKIQRHKKSYIFSVDKGM